MESKKNSLSSLMLNSWDSNEDTNAKNKKVDNDGEEILDFLKKNLDNKHSSNESLLGFLEDNKQRRVPENPKLKTNENINTSLLDLLDSRDKKNQQDKKDGERPPLRDKNNQEQIHKLEDKISADDLLKIVESSIPISEKDLPKNDKSKLTATKNIEIRKIVEDALDSKFGLLVTDFQKKFDFVEEIQSNLNSVVNELNTENNKRKMYQQDLVNIKDSISDAGEKILFVVEKTNDAYEKTCNLLNGVSDTKSKLESSSSKIDFALKAFASDISTNLKSSQKLHSDVEMCLNSIEDMKSLICQNSQDRESFSKEKRDWMDLEMKISDMLLEQEKKLQLDKSELEHTYSQRIKDLEVKEKKLVVKDGIFKAEVDRNWAEQQSLSCLKEEILDIKRDLEKQRRELAMEKSSLHSEKQIFDSEKTQFASLYKEICENRDFLSKERKRLKDWTESNKTQEDQLLLTLEEIREEKESLSELKKELMTIPLKPYRRKNNSDIVMKRKLAINRLERYSHDIQQKL